MVPLPVTLAQSSRLQSKVRWRGSALVVVVALRELDEHAAASRFAFCIVISAIARLLASVRAAPSLPQSGAPRARTWNLRFWRPPL